MKRLAIYAHYDAKDEVKRYVVHHLRALGPVCDRLEFVSTAKLPESERAKAARLCAQVELRDNVGFDFAMWQHALAAHDLRAWDEVLLTNSSVFGPVFPLGPIFERMAGVEADFWGMTDFVYAVWHLQSYFIVFRRAALDSPAFAEFWRTILPYRNKWQAIMSYEVGLSVFLTEAGLRGSAFVPVESLPRPAGTLGEKLGLPHKNPTVFHSLGLLERGMPYVKTNVLRDNPGAVPLAPLLSRMQASGYDRSLIEFDREPLTFPKRPLWQRLLRRGLLGLDEPG